MFQRMLDAISEAIVAFWDIYLNLRLSMLDVILSLVVAAFPDLTPHAGTVRELTAFANWVCPLDYGFGLVASYCTYIIVIMLVKFVLACIPAMSR